MKSLFRLALLGLTLVLGASSARADIIHFDDITGDPVGSFGNSNYGGLNWGDNWGVVSNAYYASYGNSYGAPSPEYAAFNEFGVLSVTAGNATLFDFVGAQFSGWASNDQAVSFTATTITVNGYNNNVLVGTASINLSANSYTFLNANLLGVDRLDFISSGQGQWFLMDNFEFAAAVPAPSGILLAGLGAVVALGYRRLRRPKVAI